MEKIIRVSCAFFFRAYYCAEWGKNKKRKKNCKPALVFWSESSALFRRACIVGGVNGAACSNLSLNILPKSRSEKNNRKEIVETNIKLGLLGNLIKGDRRDLMKRSFSLQKTIKFDIYEKQITSLSATKWLFPCLLLSCDDSVGRLLHVARRARRTRKKNVKICSREA